MGGDMGTWSVNRDDRPFLHPAAWALAAALVVTVAAVVIAGSTVPVLNRPSEHAASGRLARSAMSSPTESTPILGLLQATVPDYAEDRVAGVESVTVSVGWDDAEPAQGSFSSSYMSSIQSEVAVARADGLGVVLDPGLQYPPTWALSLPGGTQFVDQYGDVYSGAASSGDDVVNAVTDMAVRSAEGSYLSWLGSQIAPGEIIAVRQGGGPLGELRYPSGEYGSHTDSYWAYDTSTQAALPASVRGWVPGTGTTSQAQVFLTAYNQNLDDYAIWLNGQFQADFATKELVMLPGWGQRPGGAATAVAALLAPNPPMDEFNQGLDWADLLSALPDAAHSVAYTTYLDAPTVLPTPQLEDPADYLSSLVAGTPVELGGENTGDGTLADLDLCMARAAALGFFIVDWMGQSQLTATASGTDPGGPTLAQVVAAFDAATEAPGSTLTVTTASLPSATVDQPYSAVLADSGGAPPLAWSVGSGALPAGLSLNPTSGAISGIPTSAGRTQFTVGVDDGAGSSATATLAITVSAGEGSQYLTAPVAGMGATPDGGGYWIVDSGGDVETFGDATYFGSMAGQHLNAPILHVVATPDGGGYWLVASDGGIFAFGDAPFYGSMGGRPLSRPVVGISADPATGGYWLVASDGGIFAFGAPFFGSTGSLRLNKPIVGMAGTVDGGGYWFVGSDGGVFAFGDAPFRGSAGSLVLNGPVVGMTAYTVGGGYWLVGADGGVFSFGAPFFGAA